MQFAHHSKQSAKKNTIKVLDPKDCGGNCNCVQPAMTDTGTGSDVCKQEVKAVHDVEVQTTTTLPDVIRDVMWTPSGIEPMLEIEEDNGILEQGIMEGNAVDDIDNIETEKDAPESPEDVRFLENGPYPGGGALATFSR